MPERLAGPRVDRDKVSFVVAGKHQPDAVDNDALERRRRIAQLPLADAGGRIESIERSAP